MKRVKFETRKREPNTKLQKQKCIKIDSKTDRAVFSMGAVGRKKKSGEENINK